VRPEGMRDGSCRVGVADTCLATPNVTLETSHRFAIEVMFADVMENEKSSNRFLREIKALGTLNHRNIVSAVDAGQEGRS